jgi:hypothetical protein
MNKENEADKFVSKFVLGHAVPIVLAWITTVFIGVFITILRS